MTERERDMELLDALLLQSEETSRPAAAPDALLTRGEERRLLQEANDVAPPTLAAASGQAGASAPYAVGARSPASFGAEVIDIVRRHPIPALLFGIGLVLMLRRRRA